MEKQLKPRGRPWPKGVSGNPRGRPRGGKNKLTLMVEEGIARAVEKLSWPLKLDQNRHYEVWSDCYIQDGMRFERTTLERVNPEGPIPIRPERLEIREIRVEVMWKARRYWSQRGWLFDMDTHLPVDL